jgi:hypothetical protein
MSDEFYDEYGDPIRDENIRSQMKALKAQAEKAKELETALAERDREIGFAKAGIPDDGLGALFRDAYKGEASAEAIRAKAIEYGILKAEGAMQAPDTSEAELDALRRAAGVTASGGESIVDPQAAFLTALASANSADEAASVIDRFSAQTGVFLDRGM